MARSLLQGKIEGEVVLAGSGSRRRICRSALDDAEYRQSGPGPRAALRGEILVVKEDR